MNYYNWNPNKNIQLQKERGISFEQVVFHIEKGDLLAIIDNPNRLKYPNQKIFIVRIHDYVYLIPFVMEGNKYFFKTIIPSRKAKAQFFGGTHEENNT